MIFYDLINLKKIRRALMYALCLLITMTVQGSLLSRISILGAKPMIVPVIVVAMGLFEGGLWGGVFGLIAGVLCDLASSDTVVTFTIVLAAEGFLAGLMGHTLINRRCLSCVILCVLGLLLLAVCQIVPLWIYKGASIAALGSTALLQTAWSAPFSVPAYLACKAVATRGAEQ
jgi:cell shape-determining protein MreD